MRIISELDRSFWDFVCRWADPESEIALNYAPHFHFQDEPDTPFVMCLIRNESQNWKGTGKCLFLEETPATQEHPLGIAKCGIYESRPAACRSFPMKLNDSAELAIIQDVPQRGRLSTDPVYKLCPRPWEISDCDPVQAVQDLIVAKYEMRFFHSIANVWNRRPGEFAAFPEFLNLIYSQRVRKEFQTQDARSLLPEVGPKLRAA